MSVKNDFIRKLIDELNSVNKERLLNNDDKNLIDVCFMVSVIDQGIEKCTKFIEEMTKYDYHINRYIENKSGEYTNSKKIEILFEKPECEKESEYWVDNFYDWRYEIEFSHDDRSWGYCQCTLDDEGYNEEYDCCGNGCDWSAPAFSIEKIISVTHENWQGSEKDYWEYEEKFYSDEQNKDIEVEKYEKEKRIKSIKDEITKLQEELNKEGI